MAFLIVAFSIHNTEKACWDEMQIAIVNFADSQEDDSFILQLYLKNANIHLHSCVKCRA